MSVRISKLYLQTMCTQKKLFFKTNCYNYFPTQNCNAFLTYTKSINS